MTPQDTTLNPDVTATSAAVELLDRHFLNGYRRLCAALDAGGKVDGATVVAKLPSDVAVDVLAAIAWLNSRGSAQ